jgi:predicted dehydrogenase
MLKSEPAPKVSSGSPVEPVRVALYGDNGHQIHQLLETHPMARLVATAQFPREKLPRSLQDDHSIREVGRLDDLLADPEVELICLCSPRRADQAGEAIRCLSAGKHVYAEKPCALSESALDEILRAARQSGRLFHEMADTSFCQPYYAMKRIVSEGRIGKVVQVTAEKSYPYHPGRPQDESVDGGLIEQCAVHAMRFVEHVAGLRVESVRAIETGTGNPVAGGGLRMAAALLLSLEGGAVGTIAANYLNPRGTGVWGYETLRIFGTDGMVESMRGGEVTRLVIGERDFGPLEYDEPGLDYLNAVLGEIRGVGVMPFTQEEELSPTRWVIRAKTDCR